MSAEAQRTPSFLYESQWKPHTQTGYTAVINRFVDDCKKSTSIQFPFLTSVNVSLLGYILLLLGYILLLLGYIILLLGYILLLLGYILLLLGYILLLLGYILLLTIIFKFSFFLRLHFCQQPPLPQLIQWWPSRVQYHINLTP